MKILKPLAAACLLATLTIAVVGNGCATPPIPKEEPTEEVVLRKKAMNEKVVGQLKTQLTFARDKELEHYLKKLALRLGAPGEPGIHLVKDGAGKSRPWREFGLPVNRIFLSVSVLKRCEFETEVAGLLALELAHLAAGDVQNRIDAAREMELAPGARGILRSGGKTDFFGPAGVLAFKGSEREKAVTAAASVLYQRGFDPRGLISALQILQRNPERAWIDADSLDRMMESARKETSKYPPLRNPVVRSNQFVSLKTRIKNL